jgi:hypothetical protein
MEMASTHETAPTDFHNPAVILAKPPMAVKEKASAWSGKGKRHHDPSLGLKGRLS